MFDTRAAELVRRLREDALTSPLVDNVEPVRVNEHAAAREGYAARVFLQDGTHLDVIGGETSGYCYDGQRGWVTYDRLLAILFPEPPADEVSPATDRDLAARLTAVAVAVREIAVEVAAIRDEVVTRRGGAAPAPTGA